MTSLIEVGKDSPDEAIRVCNIAGHKVEIYARIEDPDDPRGRHIFLTVEDKGHGPRRRWTWRFLYGFDSPPCLGRYEAGYWDKGKWRSSFTFLTLAAAWAKVKELNEQEEK